MKAPFYSLLLLLWHSVCPLSYLGLESLATVSALALDLPPPDPVMGHPSHLAVLPHPRLVEGRLASDLLLDQRPAGPVSDQPAGDTLQSVCSGGGERTVRAQVAGLHPGGARHEHVDVAHGSLAPVADVPGVLTSRAVPSPLILLLLLLLLNLLILSVLERNLRGDGSLPSQHVGQRLKPQFLLVSSGKPHNLLKIMNCLEECSWTKV